MAIYRLQPSTHALALHGGLGADSDQDKGKEKDVS